MPITITTEWQQMAIYAVGAALLLILLMNIPYVGRIVRGLLSVAMLAFCLFLLMQHGPYQPDLARIMTRLGLDNQQVVGDEVRIRVSPDGHFWANAQINGTPRRLLIDSGATITALSTQTAASAGIEMDMSPIPVVLRTANGSVAAQTGSIETLRIGSIEAKNLKVVVSPALGDMDVLGMNLLSQLAAWRVEGRTLILTPARKVAQ
jgi:aspartyl protease family protein